MSDQYLEEFVRESEEAITALNNSLLDLESDPDDEAAMEQIFRTAHTLKGNFGAMGFEEASELAHAIEDLLDGMRDESVPVSGDVMDLIFEGVDRIEAIVTEIDETGETDTATADLVDELRATHEAHESGDAEAVTTEQTGATEGGADPVTVLEAVDTDPTEGLVAAELAVGGEMPGVDAMLALEAIEDQVAILGTVPDREDVEDGAFEESFLIALDAPDDTVAREAIDAAGDAEIRAIDTIAPERIDDARDQGDTSESDGDLASAQSAQEIKSVRVDVDQLDDLHGQVEQLVTSRIKLRRAVEDRNFNSANDTLNELDKVTANLQNTVMDMRLVPLKKVVGKFPRLVRDLARDLDKEITFEIDGEDIELDRTILTEISDPLMHILRNSVDHGIERPDEREAAGKPREGQIELRATRERDHVVITVEDDGAGLDADEIRDQARREGVRSSDELDAMSDDEVYDLVFHPGFSTSEEVTDVSGRGVGMDVVHETVSQLDGSVDVASTLGEGTTVSLRLPVTMAIVKVLFVSVAGERYGIPIKNVDEITRSTESETINGRPVIRHNDEIYPVIDLGEAFDVPGARTNGDGMLVRVRESERRVALHCDAVEAQEEVVVKPLEGILSGTPGLSGTAVLGDGNIVHIIDVVTL
ncbi:chemotaxis protein CheA [Halococcoides cellulosivorans]|uniref:Chemotaxis protein CheA n=1 Tax=Halococcoides cellulosivorans TaxID=1679096 RepID=A0A2R4X064_9EURY|nr:chemotaxis protein CheA [Halococcoides cellulosivorans]AWB27169.1 chemotaxis protein CheA [Halococcoides cellulosivorans]